MEVGNCKIVFFDNSTTVVPPVEEPSFAQLTQSFVSVYNTFNSTGYINFKFTIDSRPDDLIVIGPALKVNTSTLPIIPNFTSGIYAEYIEVNPGYGGFYEVHCSTSTGFQLSTATQYNLNLAINDNGPGYTSAIPSNFDPYPTNIISQGDTRSFTWIVKLNSGDKISIVYSSLSGVGGFPRGMNFSAKLLKKD